MEKSEFWLQKKADVLKPVVEHGKITATVSCYMVKKCASPHNDGKGGGFRGTTPLILNLGTRWG